MGPHGAQDQLPSGPVRGPTRSREKHGKNTFHEPSVIPTIVQTTICFVLYALRGIQGSAAFVFTGL